MRFILILSLVYMTTVPAIAQSLQTPVALEQPVVHSNHGVDRVDPYFWMNERDTPEILEYLHAENAYGEAVLAPVSGLIDEIYDEIIHRIKQDDSSVPYFENGYYYQTRFEEGKDYPIYVRRPGSMDASEEILLDVNELAEGHSFFNVVGVTVSDDGRTLAYAEDTVGRNRFRLRIKDLTTGETLEQSLYPISGNIVWAADNETLFVGRRDEETLRAYQILRYTVGSDTQSAVVVYHEADDTFSTGVTRTKSREYILFVSSQTVSTEWHFIPADNPLAYLTLIEPRRRDHRYSVDHLGDHFYIQTDLDGALNSKLVRTPVNATSSENWEDIIPHRDDVLLQSYELFTNFLVLSERENGLIRLRVIPWGDEAEHFVAFDEPTYSAGLTGNREIDTTTLQFRYSSMTTPGTTYEYDLVTRERTVLKQDEVLGDFSRDNYVTERVFATAQDGTQIPISLVYRKGTPLDGTSPLHLYGYGSYGISMEASFSIPRLSLLDRGFIYAIAHIRGGQEMGRHWYEDGKLFNKMNTFTDFIAAGEHLIAEGYADPNRIYAEGRSAGGLLIGAVINLRPDLFSGVLAGVPFVDVVTTMLDDTIPLTTFEYDEWGNPNIEEYFHYMLSYSPYDNVATVDYPAIFVTHGYHDSAVQYWEPAKWVARLRTLNTGSEPILFITNMEAGHTGSSGRFQRFREISRDYAFLIGLAEERL